MGVSKCSTDSPNEVYGKTMVAKNAKLENMISGQDGRRAFKKNQRVRTDIKNTSSVKMLPINQPVCKVVGDI